MLDADQIADLLRTASVRSACAEERAKLEAALHYGLMRYGVRAERDRMRDEVNRRLMRLARLNLSPAQKREIVQRHKRGCTTVEIGRRMGISQRAVVIYLRERSKQT